MPFQVFILVSVLAAHVSCYHDPPCMIVVSCCDGNWALRMLDSDSEVFYQCCIKFLWEREPGGRWVQMMRFAIDCVLAPSRNLTWKALSSQGHICNGFYIDYFKEVILESRAFWLPDLLSVLHNILWTNRAWRALGSYGDTFYKK